MNIEHHEIESAANATSLPPFLHLMWMDRSRRRTQQMLTAVFFFGLLGLVSVGVCG